MDNDNDENDTSIPSIFDRICFEFGEKDAIVFSNKQPLCYLELQQSYLALACQLYFRYRPTYCLVDVRGEVAAEAVSMLACMRIGVPFVPVSADTHHAGKRLEAIVSSLRNASASDSRIVAIVQCDNDKDPILTHYSNVNVHNVVYVNNRGDLVEPMNVSDSLPNCFENDEMYVLFTSGTSGNTPKAVVGSAKSTLHRLKWFAKEFPSKQNTVIARRNKLAFVDSITELFSALLFPPAVLYAIDELEEQGISAILNTPCTRVTMLPSQLSQLLMLAPTMPSSHSLEMIVVSGEPCPSNLLGDFTKLFPNTVLINLYGQTESTGDVLCAVLTEMNHPIVNNVVSVGKPIPGVSLQNNNELVVSGNLAARYLHSKTHFTSFPTGDVGFEYKGNWYVRGRLDDVCKVNGIITSPSEVEAVVMDVYNITSCAACIIDSNVYVLVEQQVSFSREKMRNAAGVPWNLVPKEMFCVESLFRSGSAGKIDRARVRQHVMDILSKGKQLDREESQDEVDLILHEVLGVQVLDSTKSFVEMGGDSALAITLLYKLRAAGKCGKEMTAWHILNANSICELKGLILDERCLKRRRPENEIQVQEPAFEKREILHLTEGHVAVQFKACVDAAPLVHGADIYAACQGGIIQRIVDGNEVASVFDLGCSIQADLIVVDDSIIACGYDSEKEDGIVAAIKLDLSEAKWTRKMNGMIKSRPVHIDSSVYVLAGKHLHIMRAQDGDDTAILDLPSGTESSPTVATTEKASRCIVYAFSDWDASLEMVTESTVTHIPGVEYPVYSDLLNTDDNTVFFGDICGHLHAVNVSSGSERKHQVSNKPIFSGPALLSNGTIVFGCHDGIVRCVNNSDLSIRWEYDARSVVYSKPLVLEDDSIVVCSTAGDIINLSKCGEESCRCKIDGEIWSDPVMIDKSRIAVGGRDSKLHIVDLGCSTAERQ